MKFILQITTLTAIVLLVGSCRKGENDPWLTLRTRKARLTGEWQLVSGFRKEETPSNHSSNTSIYSEEAVSAYYVTSGGSSESEFKITENKLIFSRDGTFERKVSTIRNGLEFISKNTGIWTFLGRNSNQKLKNKEAIMFSEFSDENFTIDSGDTSVFSYDHTGLSADYNIWLIDRLSNKELIFKGYYETTSNSLIDGRIVSFEYKFKKI